MTDKPLVTIIMAAKNTAPYLRACLDSISNQTYENWELLVCNDHSTDETPQILESYAQKDQRIKVYLSKGERLIPALQTAYAESSGVLINRMDSDDKMPNYKLETLVAEWLKYGKGYVIAGGTEHFVDEGEVGEGFRKYEQWLNRIAKHNLHHQEIYRECVIPSHCWIIHRDDFERIDAFNPVVYPEDYDVCFRMYAAKLKIIGMDKVLHYWRDRSNRISRTWEEYKDNRYYDLKVKYFMQLDRDTSRELVIWGAGKNGKDLVKVFQGFQPTSDIEHQTYDIGHQTSDGGSQLSDVSQAERGITWVCDNDKKIGKDIYGVKLHSSEVINQLPNCQIIIAVSSPTDKIEIEDKLKKWGKQPVEDYWFFT